MRIRNKVFYLSTQLLVCLVVRGKFHWLSRAHPRLSSHCKIRNLGVSKRLPGSFETSVLARLGASAGLMSAMFLGLVRNGSSCYVRE